MKAAFTAKTRRMTKEILAAANKIEGAFVDRFSHLTKMEIVEIPVGRRVCSLGKAHETKDADIFLHAWSFLSCAFMGPQNAGHRIQHGFGATKYFRRGIPGDVRHRG